MQLQKLLQNTGLLAMAALLLTIPMHAQSGQTSQQSSTGQAQAEPQPDSQTEAVPRGKVIFSRSLDMQPSDEPTPPGKPGQPENPALHHRPAAPTTEKKPTVTVTDVERGALTFTRYDLDVRLTPADSSLAVRAEITLRNDGPQPLLYLPLQISSSLIWQSVRVARGQADGSPGDGGKELAFAQHTIDSDVDHTGQVNEAVVTLARPLAPKASLTLDVIYSGQIPLNAKRLQRIGAPQDVAQSSDWDRIAPDFIGLRGFGNVLWYPATAEALKLGDGARLFQGIGRWKLRQQDAMVRMRVQLTYEGEPPTLAVLDGQVIPLEAAIPPEQTDGVSSSASSSSSSSSSTAAASALPLGPPVPKVISFDLPATRLGFQAPSLFVMTRTLVQGPGINIYALPVHGIAAQAYVDAAGLVQSQMQQWLGAKQQRDLALIDLPEAEDQPFETGATVLLPLQDAQSGALTPLLSHEMAHAWFRSPRPWMDEGIAQFMGLLWLEHTNGRDAALRSMAERRDALALAEPADPQKDPGQSLIEAHDDIYYRTKAAYVWWMLRDMVGDKVLRAALHQYQPEADTEPQYFEHLLEQAGGPEQTSSKNLQWFFHNWVYDDRGLPDLSITSVVPRLADKNQYLVAVEVANNGGAAAEVPVTVLAGVNSATQRVLVNAHARASVRVLIPAAPGEVRVNDGSVPESRASIHRREIALPAQN